MPHGFGKFQAIADVIEPSKDVSGLSSYNLSHFDSGNFEKAVPLAKAAAFLKIVKKVIGNIDGKATAIVTNAKQQQKTNVLVSMLLHNNASVLVLNENSNDLNTQLYNERVVIDLTNSPRILAESLHSDALVLINAPPSDRSQHPNEIPVSDKVHAAVLFENILRQWHLMKTDADSSWSLEILKPKRKNPVPSDIEISRAQAPKQIVTVRNSSIYTYSSF
jgi:5,10-methylene-tetrahydrofolate dehydrogenase/methenyl tetrahydrofolate cyclohydrolase